ncbi:hypothetical protein DYE49_12285 [Treponema rectale]|uniref:Uncharacterized protein n=1 Tax=Treponema rectale TaxID=744512 RepID=A0A840SHL0_9SPIR|nr:hypothetical protein [Treponema rectale]MBB5218901.1 hypothetical protein [Treponema rectale]QOS41184.1 hypothetical protein DYE49_12285 [Treponema rectale]
MQKLPGRVRVRYQKGFLSSATAALLHNTSTVAISMSAMTPLVELQQLCEHYNGKDKSAILKKIGELKEKLAL